jgi:hypothetical protein
MNAKSNNSVKETKKPVSPDYVVHRLSDDARTSVLIVSVLANLFFLIGWLVIQVSNRYDAALINYLQNR